MINKLITLLTNKETDKIDQTPETFIWGVVSLEEDFFLQAGKYSLNDIELLYNEDTQKYSFNIKTVYMFDNKSAQYAYMQGLLNDFTKWMNEHYYDTTLELSLWNVFGNGISIKTEFNSIEEAYAAFKMMVTGFCSLQKED